MGEKFALVIGIETYIDRKIPEVQHAEADAKEIAEVLLLHGFEGINIQILLSLVATKATIESRLRRILSLATVDDQIILFYAGHGFAENDHNYLTCSDTTRGDLVNTSISL